MLGLVFGWLAVHTEKKIGGSLLRAVFSCFYGQKNIFSFKYCSVRTKKLHRMKVKKNVNFFLEI